MEGCEQQWDISVHPAFGKKQRHEEGISHLVLFFLLHPVAFVWLFAESAVPAQWEPAFSAHHLLEAVGVQE